MRCCPPFCLLSSESEAYSVDVVVRSLVTLNGDTWSDVGEQGEGPSKGQVERDVTFTDGGSQRTLESDSVLLDRVDGVLWNRAFAVNNGGGDVYFFPLDRDLKSVIFPCGFNLPQSLIFASGPNTKYSHELNSERFRKDPITYLSGFENKLDRLGNLGSNT